MRWSWVWIGLLACNGNTTDTATTGDGDGDTDADTDECDTPETYAAACAGPVSGSFDSDGEDIDDGTLEGDLCQNGVVSVRFDSEVIGGTISSSGRIAEDGSIDGGESGLSIVGMFDLVTCIGNGTWDDSNFGLSGTWEMASE
jgi:hypothetical protein